MPFVLSRPNIRNFYRYLGNWKDRPVASIRNTDVQILVNTLAKGPGKTTANRTLELLRASINKGIQWKLVAGANPAVGISRYKMKPRNRFLYENEIPKLMAAIMEESEDIRDLSEIILTAEEENRQILFLGCRFRRVLWHNRKLCTENDQRSNRDRLACSCWKGKVSTLARAHRT